jgi:hypothetical protein
MKEFSTRHLESKKSTSYSLWISFRSRNSFLGDSLAAIMANEAAEGDITYVPDYIKMEPGTKYGTMEADFMVFKW